MEADRGQFTLRDVRPGVALVLGAAESGQIGHETTGMVDREFDVSFIGRELKMGAVHEVDRIVVEATKEIAAVVVDLAAGNGASHRQISPVAFDGDVHVATGVIKPDQVHVDRAGLVGSELHIEIDLVVVALHSREIDREELIGLGDQAHPVFDGEVVGEVASKRILKIFGE